MDYTTVYVGIHMHIINSRNKRYFFLRDMPPTWCLSHLLRI